MPTRVPVAGNELFSHFQSLQIPGLLYFMCGALMILSATACIFLVETKNTDLEDILPTKHKHTSERGTELNKL